MGRTKWESEGAVWRCLLCVCAVLLWGCGRADSPAITPDASTAGPDVVSDMGGAGQSLVTTILTPPRVAPGGAVTLSVSIPDRPGLQDSAWVSVEGQNTEFMLTRDGEVWTGVTSLEAPTVVRDHRVEVKAFYAGGEARGYALLAVSVQVECPAGERRQGGACYPVHSGGVLDGETRLIRTNRHSPERTMAHPRAITRVGDKLVACITDAMAVVRLEDMVPLHGETQSTGPDPAWIAPYAETLYEAGGLAHCNDMAFDATRGIAMAASRGDLAGPGGVTTWRYPDLDADALTPPEPLGLWETGDGFERLIWDGAHLFGTQHPDALVVMEVDDAGQITEVGRFTLEGALSVWALAKDEDLVYITDAGDHQIASPPGLLHNGEEHTPVFQSGRLYVVDVSTPSAPLSLGWTPTIGLGKGVATLGDGVVAVGGGTSGVELLDLSNPRKPEHLHRYPTPGLAHGLHASGGLLAVGAWDAVVLFDASERGVLRQLDADGFVRREMPPRPSSHDSYGGLFGGGFVHLDGDQLLFNEWNTIFVTTLQPGGVAPRVTLSPRVLVANAEAQAAQSFNVRVHNGGREALWVAGVSDEEVIFEAEGVVVAPGSYGDLSLSVQPGFTGSSHVTLETNDPWGAERGVHLARVAGNYAAGDKTPAFRLPAINHCEIDADCDMTPVCMDSRDVTAAGRPALYAFFSSW
jgi:hypothetical protein